MATISLVTIADGSPAIAADVRNNYAAIATAINGGLDANNWAAGKLFAPSKLTQEAATNGQVIAWSGTQWQPATLSGGEVVTPVQITTDTTTTSTTLADLVTFGAATFEAVRYYLEIAIPVLRHSVANGSTQFQFMEGAATVGNPIQCDGQATAGNGVNVFYRQSFTPTAAAHTYKIQWKTVAACTATVRTTGLIPAEFRIVKA